MIETEFAGKAKIVGVDCVVSYDGQRLEVTEEGEGDPRNEFTCEKAHQMVALLEGSATATPSNGTLALAEWISGHYPERANRSFVVDEAISLLELGLANGVAIAQLDRANADLHSVNQAVYDALDCHNTGLSPLESIAKLKELATGRAMATEIDATDLDLDVRGNQFILRMGSAKRAFSSDVSKALAEALLASQKGSRPVEEAPPAPVPQKPVVTPANASNGAPPVAAKTENWVASDEEEDQDDEQEEAAPVLDIPQEIKDTKKLASVITWLRENGTTEIEQIVEKCEEMRTIVPYIGKIRSEDLKARIERTIAVMDG